MSRKKGSNPPSHIFDGAAEARWIALACSQPPEGYARWSLRVVEKRVVELRIVESASDTTIHRVLKKHAQTALQPPLGDPAQGKCRFCRSDGGRTGDLRPPAGAEPISGLSRRDLQAADRANAHPDPDTTRVTGSL